MQTKTPQQISAHALLQKFERRGVRLSVEHVREADGTRWWRVWLREGRLLTGDFEVIARVKPELVEILRALGHIEHERLPLKRRPQTPPPTTHTPIWNGPYIPPLYRGILAELRGLRR